MTSRKRFAALSLAVACLLCATGTWAQATAEQAPASPEDLARRLLEVTGAVELGKQVMTQMVGSLRGTEPSVPEEFWDEFLASVDTEGLVELVVPIYVRYLTAEEMTAAIEFFSSPAGRSLIEKQPAIAAESMAAGQSWGQDLAKEVVERLELYKLEKSGA